MTEVKHRPASHVVGGLQLPVMFSAENVQSALSYKPRPDDVILVTYPKCGTTWSQHMLTLIFRRGVAPASGMESFAASPFLEFIGADGARVMKRPGIIKTHFPYHLTPYCAEAKYIYVTRNPKDCCVSFFHHNRNIAGHQFEGSFDEFFELFISGEVDYGDYFDHLLEWYKHKDDPNVLFATYEEMKADPRAAALKFATFLGKEYVDLLNNDPKVLEDVIHYSSFDYMKKKINEDFDQLFTMDTETLQNDPNVPETVKKSYLKMNAEGKKHPGKKPISNFIRKGIVGDWRNHFSEEQNRRMDEKIAQKLKGTEFLDLWKDFL